MLRNVYPAEFQIHPRNTNLWNTVTKWWWYISARYRYPDPYSTRGGSVRQSLALLGAETATPSAPIRHRDPFAAIESRKLFFSRKSSIIDKSLLFSSAFFSWELIILRERFYFRFIIIENRTISSGVLENEEYFFKFLSLSRIFFAKWAWRVATIIQK